MKEMKSKSKSKVEERTATPKMTAEQKACLAACKSLAADVNRAKNINVLADCVLRDLCKSCNNENGCKKRKGHHNINCLTAAIAAVAVGMILEAKGGAK